jgi:DNA-binding NtrC family response regulator
MSAVPEKVRILLIRPWTEPLRAFRDALRAAEIQARISRVDIEPALNAALSRSSYDLIVLDPRTPGITRELLDERLREHRRIVQVVMFGALDVTIAAIERALRLRFN